jgi:hypothetical protein
LVAAIVLTLNPLSRALRSDLPVSTLVAKELACHGFGCDWQLLTEEMTRRDRCWTCNCSQPSPLPPALSLPVQFVACFGIVFLKPQYRQLVGGESQLIAALDMISTVCSMRPCALLTPSLSYLLRPSRNGLGSQPHTGRGAPAR